MFTGRTYTLSDPSGDSSGYYRIIRDLADKCLEVIPGEKNLRDRIRCATSWHAVFFGSIVRRSAMDVIVQILEKGLSSYLTGVEDYLKHLSLTERLDRTLRTGRRQYLLFMLEIELTNRINLEKFRRAAWKMALLGHCLRDFRDHCGASMGDVEERCAGCDRDCYMHLGSDLAERYGVTPCISVSRDHRRLFKALGKKHSGMGVLGVACIPELVRGLRLCDGLEIPAVGVPLDANRCSRWFGKSLETTFNLEELERILKAVPGT